MAFVLTADAVEFRDAAWDFLEARIECNILATVLLAVLEGRYADAGSLFAYGRNARGAVTAAALRTPPYPLVASDLAPGAADELIDAWLERDAAVPGANSSPATARTLAAAWQARTGGCTRRSRSMAMHSLGRVVDPRRTPAGRLRLADPSERALLIDWWRAFAREADSLGERAAENVDARLENGHLFVWDDGGPASLVGLAPPVAGVTRIGPVYTPPERRRRGYAGKAVADASRWALADGARGCMLFTDLANPTSNKIYAEVGYARFGDWEEHLFERPRVTVSA